MRNVDISIDPEDVLDAVGIEDVIEHYSEGTILDEIGIKKVLDYFYIDDVMKCYSDEDILDEIDEASIKKYAIENLGLIEEMSNED